MKWFWPSFFLFLMTLIVALGLWRPTQLDQAMAFVGWYLVALLAIVLLALIAGSGILGVAALRKSKLVSLRQRDGAFPLQRIKLRGGAVLYFNPNQTIGAATVVHPTHGVMEIEPSAGWQHQTMVRLAVERTRQLQAVFPGDDVRTNRHGAHSQMPKLPTWRALAEERAKLPLLPAPQDEESTAPTQIENPVRLYTPAEGLHQNAPTRLVLGQTDAGEIVRWDVTASPHLRVHGKSQGAGKTNLIRSVAASALRMGHHVIVCDRRRFKDWPEFSTSAELIDVRDPRRFAIVAQRLAGIYQERDALLGQHGAANISQLRDAPQRVIVVIAEFGALCAQAQADGVLESMLHPLTQVLREAGATGVHVVIEDQVVDQRWPRGISTNAEPVTGYLPVNYGAAGGYYHADKLPAYTFHYSGMVFRSFDMRTVLGDALRQVRPLTTPLIDTEWRVVEERSTVPDAHGEGGQGRSTRVERENGGTGTEQATAEPGRWDAVVDAWFARNPQALAGPAIGISSLARAMCEDAEGSDRNYEAYKGRAHTLFHEFRRSVRLPGGERLGTDTSKQGWL